MPKRPPNPKTRKKRQTTAADTVAPQAQVATAPIAASSSSTSPPVDTSSDDRARAQEMVDGRIRKSTKYNYSTLLKKIQEWYASKKLEFKAPIEPKDIDEFFGHLLGQKNQRTGLPLAPDSVQKYKSALLWWYSNQGMEIDSKLNQRLNDILQGWRQEVADKKLAGLMSVFEGKRHLTFVGYRILAQKMMLLKPEATTKKGVKNTWQLCTFGWPFFVLQWNLMARSASVAPMMLQHLSWEEDSMVVTTPKNKTDQEGARVFPRHIFANPLDPIICPILALAVLIFAHSYTVTEPEEDGKAERKYEEKKKVDDRFRLFQGDKQESRYSKLLQRVLKSLSDHESTQLGTKREHIGTHSCRKGAPSYCTSMVGGPSMAQIFLRAGWSLGNVQDRYIFSGDGGDQFTGRVVCGLPNTNTSFGTLPPHFVEGFSISNDDWDRIHPNFHEFPPAFKNVCLFLLASMVYHQHWLHSTLDPGHPIFTSFLFQSGFLSTLESHVTLESNAITPTGIPPHLTMASHMSAISRSVDLCKNQILQKCEALPTALKDEMFKELEIGGVRSASKEEIAQMLEQQIKKFEERLLQHQLTTALSSSNSSPTAAFEPVSDQIQWHSSNWGGRLDQMVPEGWRLPKCGAKEMWNLWWFGNKSERIRPFEKLQPWSLKDSNDKDRLSKVRGVMEKIEDIAKENRLIEDGKTVAQLTAADCSKVFDTAYAELLRRLKSKMTGKRKCRTEQIAIVTVYEHLTGWGTRKRQKTQTQPTAATPSAAATIHTDSEQEEKENL